MQSAHPALIGTKVVIVSLSPLGVFVTVRTAEGADVLVMDADLEPLPREPTPLA